MTSDIPKVWDLLQRFKNRCEAKGWKTSRSEDWIKKGEEYHNFLWTSSVHPSTFQKIATNHRCAIKDGLSYRVVNVSYTAWLFSKTPPQPLVQMTLEDPDLQRRTAIYDLSWLYAGKPICTKLNRTGSTVFQEFERFLTEKWDVKLKSSQDVIAKEA